jgi:protein SCO1/2
MIRILHGFKLFLIPLAILLLCSCNQGQFEERIKKSKALDLQKIEAIQTGLPFFDKRTFSPTWDFSAKDSLAQLDQMELTNQSGKKMSAKDLTGKPMVVAFFFSQCADFCPMLMKNLRNVYEGLKQRDEIAFVGISIDPDRDTPAQLNSYLKKFYPKQRDQKNWVLLTGSKSQIANVANKVFQVEAFAPNNETRLIHTEKIFFLDSSGFIRKIMNGTKASLLLELETAINDLNTDQAASHISKK